MSAATPLIVQQAEAEQLLARIDVLQAMRQLFLDLAAGQALQPAQQLVEFPAGRGDFINYLGVLAQEQVYGVKTSPYIVREQGPLVTAWTLLMSMQTGQLRISVNVTAHFANNVTGASTRLRGV